MFWAIYLDFLFLLFTQLACHTFAFLTSKEVKSTAISSSKFGETVKYGSYFLSEYWNTTTKNIINTDNWRNCLFPLLLAITKQMESSTSVGVYQFWRGNIPVIPALGLLSWRVECISDDGRPYGKKESCCGKELRTGPSPGYYHDLILIGPWRSPPRERVTCQGSILCSFQRWSWIQVIFILLLTQLRSGQAGSEKVECGEPNRTKTPGCCPPYLILHKSLNGNSMK